MSKYKRYITGLMVAIFLSIPLTSAASVSKDGLTSSEVFGLWKTLRKFKAEGAKEHAITPDGGIVKTKFRVTACPSINDPYNEAWNCYAEITGTFQLQNKFHQGVDTASAAVNIVQDASGDRWQFTEQVQYDWDPINKRLNIFVTYPTIYGTQDEVSGKGTYNVLAKTVEKITTESSKYGFDYNFGSNLSLGLAKTSTDKTSKLQMLIGGNGYVATAGILEFQRLGGETVFATGMTWLTKALVESQQRVTKYTSECSGGNKYTTDIDFGELVGVESFSAGSETKSHCSLTSEQLTANIRWKADPSTYENKDTMGAVGQMAYNRIVIQDLGSSYISHYETGLTSVVNWSLSVSTSSNEATGGGFTIGSRHAVWNQVKGPNYSVSYSGK